MNYEQMKDYLEKNKCKVDTCKRMINNCKETIEMCEDFINEYNDVQKEFDEMTENTNRLEKYISYIEYHQKSVNRYHHPNGTPSPNIKMLKKATNDFRTCNEGTLFDKRI